MNRTDCRMPVPPEGWTLRTASAADLDAVAFLERTCFPPGQAAGRERLRERLGRFPGHYWLLFDGERLISYAGGMATDLRDLTDEMYADASLHDPLGRWQMLFSVCTLLEYRGRGCAGTVLRAAVADAARHGREGAVLTCLDPLVPYYARFGFVSEGRTEKSRHGNADWNQMRLTFS